MFYEEYVELIDSSSSGKEAERAEHMVLVLGTLSRST